MLFQGYVLVFNNTTISSSYHYGSDYDYCTRHRGISVILSTLVSLCVVNTFPLFIFIINNTASSIIDSIIISYGPL